MPRRRLHRTRAAAMAATVVLALTSAPAAHARPTRPGPPPTLNVHVKPEGFVVPGPNPRPGGPVTFRVTAEGAHGYWWNVYKLLNGATIEQFVEWLGQRSSPDPAVSLPAMKALYKNVHWAGGAKVYPDKPLELTQTLTPGTYYFGSLAIPGPQGAVGDTARAAAEPAPAEPSVFGWLDVTDEYVPAVPPKVDGVVYLTEVRGRDVMLAPANLPAKGRVLVRNDSTQPQEAVFMDLAPGATDRRIQDWFDAERAGTTPLPPRPFGDSIGGMLALSPHQQLIMGYELPPNRYGIFSWLRDADTGVDSAATGMHQVVRLR